MTMEREVGRLAGAVEGLRDDIRDMLVEFRAHTARDDERFQAIELRQATEDGERKVKDRSSNRFLGFARELVGPMAGAALALIGYGQFLAKH